MEQPMPKSSDDLDTFLTFLYGGLEGYIYMAAKPPGDSKEVWEQAFFEWPKQGEAVKRVINKASGAHEVYIAPSLFKEPGSSARENFKCAQVAWADFDGNAPKWESFSSEPSLVVQSSSPLNQHVYWKLTEAVYDADTIEDINKRIYFNYGADSSWDAVRVLRPPTTLHHEDKVEVKLVRNENISYEIEVFNTLAPAPEKEEPAFQLGSLPKLETVLLQYAIPVNLQGLLNRSKEKVKDRSSALTDAAYSCCQIGMKDVEVFVVLQALATKWGKFEGRKDKDKQLSNIVVFARKKYPDVLPQPTDEEVDGVNPFMVYSYKGFINAEVELDWVIEGMLMDRGNMLMAGPGGIGKTQIMMQAMKHIAMGKDWLHYKIPRPMKVGFVSLEMGLAELQYFGRTQDETLTDEERELLEENLQILPVGESVPLNTTAGQDIMTQIIGDFGWEGVFIDSIGSAILGNINSSENVQPFTNYNDRIRNRLGVFLWYIHHTRKSAPGQNGPANQDDVYGDQYLVNRCTSAYGILPAKDGLIRVRNFKNRLAAKEDDYLIGRTKHLDFILSNNSTGSEALDAIDNSTNLTGNNGIEL